MLCPACGSKDLRVLDSRPMLESNQIKRRRQCSDCEFRFSTIEIVDAGMPKIVKRSGSLAEFDVRKVRSGIMRAVEKRPLTMGQLENLIERIVQKINKMQVKHLRSEQVGYIIMEEMKDVDLVSMIRFASVYHAFQDAESFKVFIDNLVSSSEMN
ncbi:transcriptional regulator NrdR [Candidatus Synchoanobacter obligatus]|uniref:Transcriptional repressor NrdR n=1 Tax=Candidatus Synchoanobacter obligatus TaxID=2919597 RepID=A0ABT1L6D8_9GAMM|nr:transcriptional regulator NrdR [Candidatus Synchoanobacter obligatus]MCP8352448.1 transcriptional regulator NrdR [Candidatus Synchoanobacter obligatus]